VDRQRRPLPGEAAVHRTTLVVAACNHDQTVTDDSAREPAYWATELPADFLVPD